MDATLEGGIQPTAVLYLEHLPCGEFTDKILHYQLLRDGYRLHTKNSRIHVDSFNTFCHARNFFSTNYLTEIWSDSNLVGAARSFINLGYKLKIRNKESLSQDIPWYEYHAPTNDLHYLNEE